jgi:alpha-D-xyloside xylohydrolase
MPAAALNAPASFEWITRMTSWRIQGDALIATAETSAGHAVEIVLCAESPEVWHLRLTPDGSPLSALPLVTGSLGPAVRLDIQEAAGSLSAYGAALRLELGREPWCLTFRDAEGHIICRENPFDVDGLNRLFVRPLGFVRSTSGAITQVSESFHLRADEHLFGLGEKFTPLDKTRQRIVSWSVDALGAASERAYKNVPLLLSTCGYALFLNTGRRITYDLGTESCESYTLTIDGPSLDAYLIYGPTPAEILERYTRLTGRAPVPPKWSFGLWLSGGGQHRDEAAIKKLVAGAAEHDLPCDVIHVDPWWMVWRKYCDFEWDRAAFPDPHEFGDWLHRQNLKLSLWQHPYISVESDLFAEGARKGYFARGPDGEVYLIDYGLSLSSLPVGVVHVASKETSWNARVAIIDLTNPDAVNWYKALMRAVLENGADVFKTDFGEDVPADAVFANGMSGAEMHNLYPLLYNRAVFEVTEEVKGRGLVWSRSGYAGSQRYPTCWSGDPACDWDSLACTIRGGLSLGLSGVPFWSNDIGGYRGTPSEKLYIRWAQFGLLCPHARCHGESSREPWFHGERAVEIFRYYARLRYELFPYLYSCANESSRSGLPMLRAMPLAFPDDPNTYDKDLQYLLGPWLLAAPIYDDGEERRVYLPEGDWVDYWTGQTLAGPRNLVVRASLDTLPLFVRGGAIIPRMQPANRIPTGLVDPLIVEIYPHGERTYRLYEDEGITDYSCTRTEERLTIEWVGGVERTMILRFVRVGQPTRLVLGRIGEMLSQECEWEIDGDSTVAVRVTNRLAGRMSLEW